MVSGKKKDNYSNVQSRDGFSNGSFKQKVYNTLNIRVEKFTSLKMDNTENWLNNG